jgi:nucleoside-triphosphatase THEP1
MNIIITGDIGIGKTTVCKKVIEIAGSQGYICGGVITYKTRDDDIIIQDVRNGETKTLASTRGIYSGPRTAKYYFNPEGIDFGIQSIDGGITADINIIDELGQLELRGQGFAGVVEQVATGKFKNCILVIRKGLLTSFLPRLGVATTIFETTSDNRNQIPERIGAILKRVVTAGCDKRSLMSK